MVGSGLFVLPGLAAKIAGPAVVLAHLLVFVSVDPRPVALGLAAAVVGVNLVGVMMVVYTLVVFVVVGITTPETLHGSLTPMTAGAARLFGGVGEPVVAAVAALALTSVADAGVLSSSRYPLALARDERVVC